MGIRLDGNSSGRVVEQMWRLLDGGKATHQGRTESVSEDIHADSDVDKTTRARIHELVMEIGTIMPNETDCEAEKALKLTPDHPMASKILRGPNRRAPVIKATRTNGRGAETRILFIAHNFPPISFAGSELYMLNLSQALQELGAEVQVVHPCSTSPDGSSWAGFKVYDGVPVHRLPLPFVRGELFLTNDELTRQLTEVVSGYKPDIIHVQHLIGWPSNLLQFLSEFSKPVLLTLHDFYMMCLRIHLLKPDHRTICSGPRTVETCDECISSVTTHNEIKDWDHVHRFLSAHLGLYKEGYRGIDRVLAPSQYLMDIYEDNGFYNPETFHWQFGLKLFNRLAKTEPDNKVRFTYIGNLTRLKGIMDLVNAFRAISPMDAELSVWGQEFPRHLEEEFHSIADPLTHVHLKGRYTPDALPRILADGDVVVVPSHIENYPLVVREALHAGLPVIASRVGGIPEIVDDNVNGILFRPGDVQDLTAKLQSVIDRPNLLSDLAANIKPVRSIENDAQAHMNLYRGLLTEMTDKDHVEEIIESARGLALRGLSRVATKRIERALQDNPNESRLRECLAQLSQTQVV